MIDGRRTDEDTYVGLGIGRPDIDISDILEEYDVREESRKGPVMRYTVTPRKKAVEQCGEKLFRFSRKNHQKKSDTLADYDIYCNGIAVGTSPELLTVRC